MPSSLKPSCLHDPGGAPIVSTRWQDMKLVDKLFFYALAVDRDRLSQVFTIHFTMPTRDQLAKSSLSPRDFIAQRMRGYLSGVPYFFVLDISQADVLHIHGLLNLAGQDDTEIVQQLLKVAGDERKISALGHKRFFKSRAVVFEPADWERDFHGAPGNFGPYGWNHYITKDLLKVKKRFGLVSGSEVISVTQSVTRFAKQVHKEIVASGHD